MNKCNSPYCQNQTNSDYCMVCVEAIEQARRENEFENFLQDFPKLATAYFYEHNFKKSSLPLGFKTREIGG